MGPGSEREQLSSANQHRLDPARLAVALALLLAFVVYLGAVGFPFVYDDLPQIVNNPYITSWHFLPAWFGAKYWNEAWNYGGGSAAFYRPVFMSWVLLDRSLFHLAPWAWHLASIVLHVVVTGLVYLLCHRLTADRMVAGIAALLFGIHAVHVECVAWVSGATEPFVAVLFLGTLLTLMKFYETRKWVWIAASMALYALALFSKETSLALSLVVFVWAWMYAARDRTTLSKLMASGKWALPFLVMAAIYMSVRVALFHSLPPAAVQVSMRTVMLTWPSVLWFYVRQLFCPVKLSMFYDTPYVTSASLGGFWWPLAAVATVALACSWLRRRYEVAFTFALLWFVLTLLPVFNLRIFRWLDFAHDRYLYLPSVGFVLIVALVIRGILGERLKQIDLSGMQVGVLAVLVMAMSVNTFLEITPWGSNLLLYTRAIEVAPRNVAAAYLLGTELMHRGQLEDSEQMFVRATQLAPNWPAAWSSLGAVRYKQGRYPEARQALVRAAELAPQDASIRELLRLTGGGSR